jgi:hypothetical protein
MPEEAYIFELAQLVEATDNHLLKMVFLKEAGGKEPCAGPPRNTT